VRPKAAMVPDPTPIPVRAGPSGTRVRAADHPVPRRAPRACSSDDSLAKHNRTRFRFCVKYAVGANEPNDIAITRHHFDAALGLLTAAHATNAEPELPRLLLAG